MAVKVHLLLLLLSLRLAVLQVSHGTIDPEDAAALFSLMSSWKNTPPSWDKSNDPCDMNWDGVICSKSRITVIKLSTMGIKGTLSGDIGQLKELQSLDLSFNNELGGPLSPGIGNLKQLTTLILAGCNFNGNIPSELGNLAQLSFLALNSNKFTGKIPTSLGGLSNLYWLDLADNQLSGTLPVSTNKDPGLDQLLHTKHFHFNKNKLSGNIPEKLFSSNLSLIHLLFDGNQFTGEIPASLGLVQTLEVMRLDKNHLSGSVPANINSLTQITELNLANNKLSGPLPDLSGMTFLNYVDLSNNSFDPSETPAWFSELTSLTALIIESGGIQGNMPEKLFSFPQLEQVILDNNQFNGTLAMGDTISEQLQIVDFRNNFLSSFTVSSKYNKSLMLIGNPVCATQLSNTIYCRPPQRQELTPYSTSIAHCGEISCETGQSLSPQSCSCSYPYQGLMVFRAPRFRDVTNATLFQSLESSFWMKLGLTPGSVLLQNPMFDSDSYMELQVKLFPLEGMYFSRSEVLRIGFDLSNQTYKPPPMFGPYYFIATQYPFPDQGGKSSTNRVLIVSIIVGSALLIVGILGACIYAFLQKKGARRAMELSRPFSMFQLDWKRRLRIALDSARGLSYLHELADPPIIHRDVKSSNILLDDSLTAKVADFGLSRLVSEGEKGHVSTQVKGTLGYLDPEYYMSQQLTEKSDVYSFGVVMLELITARQPIEKGKYIVREVKMAIKRNDEEFYGLKEMLDPLILSTVSLTSFGRFVELAIRCVEDSAAHRPTMSEVVKEIETILYNDGFNTDSTSTSSSATDFGNTKGAFSHLFNDSFPRKEGKSSAFDYSGGFTLPSKPEPK